ncbi:Eco57I restriction-modification methylase domain-containing protein [Bradyrhizobium sp. WSM4349]|uniref:Eco57I restriction-modification methylase domain-containing protein n=1 Tax=Bradyrhizobium sp. WSM4349 TaxID=1040988 RepID=UPI00036F44AE|nr:N-6 DNA methylase [Bradyrhizobium sp. WSM4349]
MDQQQTIYQQTTTRFFGAARRAIEGGEWRCADPVACIAYGRLSRAPDQVRMTHARLKSLPLAWREHAAAVVAALQLKAGERERLGAYFTPPYLATYVLSRLTAHGYDPTRHSIIDPAAGGAAFLAPLHGLIRASLPSADAGKALKLLRGIEIDRRLAGVSKDLLAWRVASARGVDEPADRDYRAVEDCVEIADTLEKTAASKYDVVVGNPPYARIGRADYHDYVRRWPDLTDRGGYLNLSMAFLHHCRTFVKPGGLLSFVMPASMIGGPSFAAFRKSIASEIIAIDRIENRERVFLDVIQDCIVVTMRRGVEQGPTVRVGSLGRDGKDRLLGNIKLDREGARWEMPALETIETGASLSEIGWTGKIGPVVPHRWEERISKTRAASSVALLWAVAIRPDGSVDFEHMKENVNGHRVVVDTELSYVVRRPCLVIQRTANRKQKRRINAAVVDRRFLDEVGPFVAENHVIVLTPPPEATMADLRGMADLLNSPQMSALYDRICGTASVSLKTLMSMKLPAKATARSQKAA